MAAKETALEALDAKHLKDTETRRAAIEAAVREHREAQQRLDDARDKLRALQRENIAASFAYDAARAQLLSAPSKAA
jgi:hypothetical protein